MLLLSMNHLNHPGKSFLVSAAPHAEHTMTLLTLCFFAPTMTFFMTSDKNVGGVLSLDHGKSEFRETFNTWMIASQFVIALSKSDVFSGEPSKSSNRS